jgi:hypothetical protein
MQVDPVAQVADALGVLRTLSNPETRAEAENIAVALATGERLAPAQRARATSLDVAMCAVRGDALPCILPENYALRGDLETRVFHHVDGAAVAVRGTNDACAARRCVAACAAIPAACLDFTTAAFMLGSEQAARGGPWVAALAAEIVALREEVARLGERRTGAAGAPPTDSREARAAPLPRWNAPVAEKNPWD